MIEYTFKKVTTARALAGRQPTVCAHSTAKVRYRGAKAVASGAARCLSQILNRGVKSSQVNTLPKAKSKTRSKQNKDMHKCSSVYSERRVPLPVLTSGG